MPLFDPFHGLFLFPLKPSESHGFSDVSRGRSKRPVAWNGLKWQNFYPSRKNPVGKHLFKVNDKNMVATSKSTIKTRKQRPSLYCRLWTGICLQKGKEEKWKLLHNHDIFYYQSCIEGSVQEGSSCSKLTRRKLEQLPWTLI